MHWGLATDTSHVSVLESQIADLKHHLVMYAHKERSTNLERLNKPIQRNDLWAKLAGNMMKDIKKHLPSVTLKHIIFLKEVNIA